MSDVYVSIRRRSKNECIATKIDQKRKIWRQKDKKDRLDGPELTKQDEQGSRTSLPLIFRLLHNSWPATMTMAKRDDRQPNRKATSRKGVQGGGSRRKAMQGSR